MALLELSNTGELEFSSENTRAARSYILDIVQKHYQKLDSDNLSEMFRNILNRFNLGPAQNYIDLSYEQLLEEIVELFLEFPPVCSLIKNYHQDQRRFAEQAELSKQAA